MDDIATRPKQTQSKLSPWQSLALWIGICAVLFVVFMQYTNPNFLVMLSNQLWACF